MPPKHTTGVPGTIYLLHFAQPYKHARNYLGWTSLPLDSRLTDHAAGWGSRLMAVVGDAGIAWRLARVWENVDRNVERQMKNRHMGNRLCPLCRAGRAARPRALMHLTPAERLEQAGPTRLRRSTLAELAELERRYPRWAKTARHGREPVEVPARVCMTPGGHDCANWPTAGAA